MQGWEGKGRQGNSCAPGTRTIRMCSFDGRSGSRPNDPSNGIESKRRRNLFAQCRTVRPGARLARRTEEGMEPDDLLCSRNAQPQNDGRGAARPSFLLAEAARSECAPSMRAVKNRPTKV